MRRRWFTFPGLAGLAGVTGLAGLLVCCNTADLTPASSLGVPVVDGSVEAVDASSGTDASTSADAGDDAALPVPGNLRIMAANISSGPTLVYGPVEGVRIFQGLNPDVVLIQEMKVGTNSVAEIDEFVSTTFGGTFTYYREPSFEIPNGVISRYPILVSGSWTDPQVNNRGFAYAKIAIPGPHPLWAVSLHLLTSGGSQRNTEATALVAQVKAMIPAADFLVIGGDLNTAVRGEACITTLTQIVVTSGPYPDDGAGNDNTSAPRHRPYDWLLADADLAPLGVPVVIGRRAFTTGLVFDSRVYSPLADVAPVEPGDSAAVNMQHMPVVRDFRLP